jgi:hypothetical protein
LGPSRYDWAVSVVKIVRKGRGDANSDRRRHQLRAKDEEADAPTLRTHHAAVPRSKEKTTK